MNKKVTVCCDIDDTLWDLLPHWIKCNNYLHNQGNTEYQLLSEDLNDYINWDLSNKFNSEKSKQLFFNLLSNSNTWESIQTSSDRIKTLKKLNDDNRIELYIVTAMKINNYAKLQRFKELFSFIDDNQIIVCHNKWLLRSDIWIDDKAETLEKCKQYGTVIKINKPHNKNVTNCFSIDDFSELYNNTTFENLIERIYKKKMSQKYDMYIREHVDNIQRGFKWLKQNCPEILEDLEEEIQYQIIIHDDSKWSDDEYDAYDEYFYGAGKNENEFNYAWLHHIHNNPHHWQHWVLREDDGDTIPLEMPYNYIIEMILDWWSFSWKQDSLKEIFKWYDVNKSKMILHKNTKTTVEFILDKIKTILDEHKGE